MARVCVLVLGDLGRSPRMQYHAWSLSDLPSVRCVTMVGYEGEACFAQGRSPKLEERRIPLGRGMNSHGRVYKALVLIRYLVREFWMHEYDVVLVQNPPALPVLLALLVIRGVLCLSSSKRPRVILDWHNLGFTMFLGGSSLFIAAMQLAEKLAARAVADQHVCVSGAMRDWLRASFGVSATVLHDRPGTIFGSSSSSSSLTPGQRHDLLTRAGLTDGEQGATIQTTCEAVLRPSVALGAVTSSDAAHSRPFLLISSTSWTADEDFGMLLQAAVQVDQALRLCGARCVVAITGKGPLREEFEEQVLQLSKSGFLRCVSFRFLWLEQGDYPNLLRCADLGVCLHKSTSGLDLPMKVLDMFGAGLPVVSFAYESIGELVDDETGRLFSSAKELSARICELLSNPGALASLREGVAKQQRERGNWSENWTRAMRPVVEELL